MKSEFLQTVLLCVISLAVNAQTLKDWTWDTYNMKFKAPDNMVVKKSDATVYEASNHSITMDIYPRKDEYLSHDGMKNAIIQWADQVSLSYTTNSSGETQPIYLDNINGYWGFAIDGTKEGFSSSALLLVNPDYPQISFYIWISYASEYYQDAISILKSFKPM